VLVHSIILVNVNSRSHLLYAVARPSVVCLSVVGNARAPYSGDCNFLQYLYGIRYLGHPLTSTENFTEIVPGLPSTGGAKHKRGSKISRFWTYRRLYLGNGAR